MNKIVIFFLISIFSINAFSDTPPSEFIKNTDLLFSKYNKTTTHGKESGINPMEFSITNSSIDSPLLALVSPYGTDGVSVKWEDKYVGADQVGFRLYYATDDTQSVWQLVADENTLDENATSITISSKSDFSVVPTDTPRHYMIQTVINSGSIDESDPSNILSKSNGTIDKKILIVAGFDRRSGNYNGSKDFILKYLNSISTARNTNISSTMNEYIISGNVNLNDFDVVFWILGDESTVDHTFDATEQTAVETYLDAGGNLFVSGSEIGWDLDNEANGVSFYNDYLKADYVSDGGVETQAEGVASTIFDGITISPLDDDYVAQWDDVITVSSGSSIVLTYGTGTDGAGVYYKGVFGSGTVSGSILHIAFPIETTTESEMKDVFIAYLNDININKVSTPLNTNLCRFDGCNGDGDWTNINNWKTSGGWPGIPTSASDSIVIELDGPGQGNGGIDPKPPVINGGSYSYAGIRVAYGNSLTIKGTAGVTAGSKGFENNGNIFIEGSSSITSSGELLNLEGAIIKVDASTLTNSYEDNSTVENRNRGEIDIINSSNFNVAGRINNETTGVINIKFSSTINITSTYDVTYSYGLLNDGEVYMDNGTLNMANNDLLSRNKFVAEVSTIYTKLVSNWGTGDPSQSFDASLSLNNSTCNTNIFYNDGDVTITGGTTTIVNIVGGDQSSSFNLVSGTMEVTGKRISDGVSLQLYSKDASNVSTFNIGENATLILRDPTAVTDIRGELTVNGKLQAYGQVVNNVADGTDSKEDGIIKVETKGKLDALYSQKGNISTAPSLTNNSSFIIKSDNTSTGSVITYGAISGDNKFEVERWIDSSDTDVEVDSGSDGITNENKWHLVSSPVSNDDFRTFYGHFLNYYTTSEGSFHAEKDPNVKLNVGQGYVARYDGVLGGSVTDVIFNDGVLNTGEQLLDLETSPGNTWFDLPINFNLIGNPYPSNINWDEVYHSNSNSDNVTPFLYYYIDTQNGEGTDAVMGGAVSNGWIVYTATDPSAGGYTIPSNAVISNGQGFGVVLKSSPTLNKIKLDNSCRLHELGKGFGKKSSNYESDSFELVAVSNNIIDKSKFNLDDRATTNYDEDYDAFKLNSFGQAPVVSFVTDDNRKLSICRTSETEFVNVGFTMRSSGDVTFHTSNVNDFSVLILEDTKAEKPENRFTDISNSSYSFKYTDGDDEFGRFIIHFTKKTLNDENTSVDTKMYFSNNTLYLRSSKMLTDATINIYNINGVLVKQKIFSKLESEELQLNLLNGIYLVELTSTEGKLVVKIRN